MQRCSMQMVSQFPKVDSLHPFAQQTMSSLAAKNWAFILKTDDRKLFGVSILNINSAMMKLILECDDYEEPTSDEEALAIYHAYGHANMECPEKVYASCVRVEGQTSGAVAALCVFAVAGDGKT